MRHLFSACGAVVFAVTLILSHSIWKCEAEICSIFFLSYFSPALNTQYKACLKHPEPVFGYISWRFCYEVAQAAARDGLGTMDSSYLSGNRIISHGKMPFFSVPGIFLLVDATAGSIIRGKKTTRQTKGRQMKVPRKPSASSSLYARPWLLPLEQEILPVLLLHLLPEAPAPCSGCGFLLLSV